MASLDGLNWTCREVYDLHTHCSLVASQVVSFLINSVGIVLTVLLAKFLKHDTSKHANYRLCLVSLTCAISLKAVVSTVRSVKVIIQMILIHESTSCSFSVGNHLCSLERELVMAPATTCAYAFTALVIERTYATLFYQAYEAGINKNIPLLLILLTWMATTVTFLVSVIKAITSPPELYPFCDLYLVDTFQYSIFLRVCMPLTLLCTLTSMTTLILNYHKKKDTTVEVWNENNLSAKYQLDEHLHVIKTFAVNLVLIVLVFGACIFINQSVVWCNYSMKMQILTEEIAGMTFGVYAILFVVAITHDTKNFWKRYLDMFNSILENIKNRNRDEDYQCAMVNNMSPQGKEYFEYYRKLWQAEKPEGWRGFRLQYCGF